VDDRDELAAWLRLIETPGIGRETARRLLAAFGSPRAVIDASVSARRQVVNAAAATALAEPPPSFDATLRACEAWLDAPSQAPRAFVPLGDPRYPPLLLEAGDPPLALYLEGRAELLTSLSLAIVGSRHPTPQGLENARRFGASLSGAGVTVVSGLALGIDAAAHEGGLEGTGSTVAVVGTGLDLTYPKRHLHLARRIAEQGLLLSEYALGTPPLAPHFPARNRIIAGLARGTLVVEAALQSGSLITARLAAEAGREVFAIPGSIHAPQSRGCHALLKQGAKLVEQAQDVLEELQLPRPPAAPDAPDADPDPERPDALLDALGYDPVSLDALVARTGIGPAVLNAKLLELELDGRVARLPGQLFQRVGLS
jgi:DNA processing protein